MQFAYCDYIAHLIKKTISVADQREGNMLGAIGKVKLDLDEDGVFLGTTKTIELEDRFGKRYVIMIAEKVTA